MATDEDEQDIGDLVQEDEINWPDVLENSRLYRGRRESVIDKEEIYAKLNIHDRFPGRGIIYQNLPEFDDLKTCAELSPEDEMRHWTREVDRLHDVLALDQQEKPFLFTPDHTFVERLDQSPTVNVILTAKLIHSTLNICIFDAAITVIKNLRKYHSLNGAVQAILTEAGLAAEQSGTILLHHYLDGKFTNPQPPKALDNSFLQNEAFPKILDYISGQVARLLARCVDGDDWHHTCISLLAKLVAKLKIIVKDPTRHAKSSIDSARSLELLVRTESVNPSVQRFRRDLSVEVRSGARGQRSALVVDEISSTLRYYRQMLYLRLFLIGMFQRILTGICAMDDFGPSEEDAYEIINIVCAGKEQPLWSACVNRKRHILVTSEETILRLCYAGWTMALCDLNEMAVAPPSGAASDPCLQLGSVHWEGGKLPNSLQTDNQEQQSESESLSHDLIIHSGVEFLSVHTLLAMSSAFLAKRIRSMLYFSAGTSEADRHPTAFEYSRYDMKFWMKVGSAAPFMAEKDRDWAPLSEFQLPERWTADSHSELEPIKKQRWRPSSVRSCFPTRVQCSDPQPDLELGTMDSPIPSSNEVAERLSEYHRFKHELNSWEFDTDCVIVSCRAYVVSIISVWLGTVAASVIIVCVFRTKQNGIDVSNIMVFLWAVATFGVALAKSLYVDDWSWHHFLRCRMPCKSVRALASAARVPEQVVLLHLYRVACGRARKVKLKTRGPWNSLFPYQSADGFAIDCAFNRTTLLACGLLVLKVSGYDGTYVACIGGQRPTESAGWEFGAESRRLVCLLPNQSENRDEGLEIKFNLDKSFVWQKGYGLYINDKASFG